MPQRHICAECGKPYEAVRVDSILCSGACRVRRHRRIKAEIVAEAAAVIQDLAKN